MVLCKFYLQGACKLGTSCRFDHQINPVQNAPAGKNTPADLATLVKAVQADMINCEKGGQWILSSYAPFKEKPEFPGFVDKSFEEIRLQFYEAVANNTQEIYKQQLQAILLDAVMKIRALQNPSQDVINILKQIYNTQVNNATSAGFGGASAGSSIFGGTPSVFSQVAAQTNQSPFSSQSIFSKTQPSQSIFGGGQATKPFNSVFGNSAFPPQNTSGSSVFNTQPQGSIFSNKAAQYPASTSSPFTSQMQGYNSSVFNMATTSPFIQTGSLFNSQPQTTSSSFQSQPQVASMYNSQPQNTPSVFSTQSQSASMFNTQPQSTSVFSNQQGGSIFSTQSQGSSVFSAQQSQDKSVFSNQPHVATSVFNTQVTVPLFNSQTTASNMPPGPFAMQAKVSPFTSVQNQNPLLENNLSLYSKEDDLTQDEINAFKSDLFTFGMIPEKPPTLQLCK